MLNVLSRMLLSPKTKPLKIMHMQTICETAYPDYIQTVHVLAKATGDIRSDLSSQQLQASRTVVDDGLSMGEKPHSLSNRITDFYRFIFKSS